MIAGNELGDSAANPFPITLMGGVITVRPIPEPHSIPARFVGVVAGGAASSSSLIALAAALVHHTAPRAGACMGTRSVASSPQAGLGLVT